MSKSKRKSQIDTDDNWNRSFYGSPTIGGLVVVGVVIIILLFKWNCPRVSDGPIMRAEYAVCENSKTLNFVGVI